MIKCSHWQYSVVTYMAISLRILLSLYSYAKRSTNIWYLSGDSRTGLRGGGGPVFEYNVPVPVPEPSGREAGFGDRQGLMEVLLLLLIEAVRPRLWVTSRGGVSFAWNSLHVTLYCIINVIIELNSRKIKLRWEQNGNQKWREKMED